MTDDPRGRCGRREFLETLAFGGLAALGPRGAAADPPPETTRIRLTRTVAICTAPQLVSVDLLTGEGFDEVEWFQGPGSIGPLTDVASGAADIGITFSGPTIIQIDAGDPVVVLAGVHPGCFELFGTERIHSLRDLK